VQSIISDSAPAVARMAAARGLLPLTQADLLEALVHLRNDTDAAVAEAAQATLDEQSAADILAVAKSSDAPASVLGYLAGKNTPISNCTNRSRRMRTLLTPQSHCSRVQPRTAQ